MFYALFIVGTFFSFFCQNKKRVLLFFTLALALISFFRYGIGTDYFAYQYLYDQLYSSFLEEYKYGLAPQELGFRMVGSIFKELGIPYQLYISIIAAVNLFFMYKLAWRYSENSMLAMFLYFCMFYFVWTLSGLRQSLTIAIGIYYLVKCIEEKKALKIIVISILLSFIHTSSLILIALYFLSKAKLSMKNYIVLTGVAVLFASLPLGFIVNYIPSSFLVSKITPYIQQNVSLNPFDFQSVARLILLIVALIYYKQLIKAKEINYKILNVYIFSILFYFFFQFGGELSASRLSIYGRVLEILIFSNIYSLYKVKINKLIIAYLITIFSFLYLNKELNSMVQQAEINYDSESIIPYIHIYNSSEYTFSSRYYHLVKQIPKR